MAKIQTLGRAKVNNEGVETHGLDIFEGSGGVIYSLCAYERLCSKEKNDEVTDI